MSDFRLVLEGTLTPGRMAGFAAQGKVVYHRDFRDAAQELYEIRQRSMREEK